VSEWSPDTRRVLRAYLRAIALTEPLQRDLARTYDVALGDVHALRVLRDLGEVPISRLSLALSIRPSSATNLVDRLEEARLVERGADPADRRVTTVRLTARGHEALGDRALFERSDLVRSVERLTPGERQQLASLLERLIDGRPDDVPARAEVAP
jgi:DNA-binding MarR family transcriptional regulator